MGSGGDDPPFLCVGTEVSAKYRGAFCEAKVKKLVKCVKCKIFLKETQSSVLVTDENVTKGILKVGATVDLKHPESGQIVEGVVTKLVDTSMYTVVFDDGDEKTLRRTQLCLKGEKHFIESETLDNLPLSNPEHFGTPVMQNKKGKRGRNSTGNDNDETESTSSDESIQKRAEYKGRLQSLVGKVMVMETGDKRKLQVPVLVVLPDAHSTEVLTKDHLLVKSFKDGKFFSISRKDLREFSKEIAQKNDEKILKASMDKALTYFESHDLPASWERDELLGTDEEDNSEDEDSSDDEPSEDKDHFVAQLYKFMDDRGTPINKGPTLGSKDLNLYRLFKIVRNIGGYNKVTNQVKWRVVYAKMKLPPSNTAAHQIKNSYKKYLHAFEDFYRKLGSSMGTISRPGRSRHTSGRGIISFKKEDSVKKEASDKTNDAADDVTKDAIDQTPKREKSPPKRPSRQEQAVVAAILKGKEEKMKKEEMEEKKVEKEEELMKKVVKKETPVKKEENSKKQTPKVVKKEKEPERKVKKEIEEDKEISTQQKKVVRRRSLRKDEDSKSDIVELGEKDAVLLKKDKQTDKVDKVIEKDSKAKVKPAVKDEKREKKLIEEKKEELKKVTRKELKKAVKSDEENEDKSTVKKVEKGVEKKKQKADDDIQDKVKEKVIVKKELIIKKDDVDTKTQEKPSSAKKESSRTPKEKVNIKTEEGDGETVVEPVSSVGSDMEHPSGTKLQVRYGRGRNQKVYDAKVVESGKEGHHLQYLVHYAGWNVRYDEWIRPERIVKVINRPDPDKVKKAKEHGAPPTTINISGSKTNVNNAQILKKRRSGPGSTPSPKPSAVVSVSEPLPKPTVSLDSRPSPNQPVVKLTKSPLLSNKFNKARPTRSNSTEIKVVDCLLPQHKRSKRNTGLTDSSDLNLQASDSESEQSELDAEDERVLLADSPEPAELDKNVSIDSSNDSDDRESNTSSPEMPNLERKIPLDEEPVMSPPEEDADFEKSEYPCEKDQLDNAMLELSQEAVASSQILLEKNVEVLSAPKLEVVKPVYETDLKVKSSSEQDDEAESENKESVFTWDIEEEEESRKTTTVVSNIIDTIQNESDVAKMTESENKVLPVNAPILEKQGDTKEEANVNIDKPAPDITPEVFKCNKSAFVNNSALVDDRFEFRDDEEEITLPDLRAETEKELKERLKFESLEIEKRVAKGKKREFKVEKKDLKEKKEVKKGKMTMAERKMVMLPEGFAEAHHFEPPHKKTKEEKHSDSNKTEVVAHENQYSTIDDAISSVCDRAREEAAEENEVEKKRVKKKVKKKQETFEMGDIKKESKKDNVKSVKTVKVDKVGKGKSKKNKDGGEGDSDHSLIDSHSGAISNMDFKNDAEMTPFEFAAIETNGNKSKTVIKSPPSSSIDSQPPPVLSGMDVLSGVALMSERDYVKSELEGVKDSGSLPYTVLDNTPPTTPEHDSMDSTPCSSQHHSSSTNDLELKVSSNIHSSVASEQHYHGGESLAGNTSPSSNDGSVGSGNVACSESSNGEVSVTPCHHHGKRRRESDELTPSKKKRRGKSKIGAERKSSRQLTVGSDSDETTGDRKCMPESTSRKSSNYVRPPKYHLNLEEGKYLEGEERISFLMEKIQEIRKTYMQLKSEVACIDRRRKRARRKEKERDSVHSSSTAAEVECSR